MTRIRGTIWGAVAGLDALTLLLIVTMWFGNNSVLYWLWDSTAGLWLFAMGGAMLGLSFAYSTRNEKPVQFKIPQGLAGGAYSSSEYQPKPAVSREEREKSGK